jgi:ABC-type transport system involved in cytochrome c biogenesis ATPase subunit
VTGTLEPTHGSVFHEGRIAALLELGAGFNPEFTGVENIFMNSSLMGFSRSETEARLPEIKRFAEIGDFVYQPVKTYSSGMYVRLAFATAVNADPQILVVDEALAVGDAVFQHRCLRRIKEMQEGGTTILFVSQAEADGKPSEVLNRYQKIIMSRTQGYEAAQASAQEEIEDTAPDDQVYAPLKYNYRHGDGSAQFLSVELLDARHRPVEFVETGEPVLVRVRARCNSDMEEPVCGFLIRDSHGIHVYGTNTEIQQVFFGYVRRGEVIEATFAFNCWLAGENFSLTVALHSLDGISYDWLDGVLFFRVLSPVVIDGISNLNASVTTRRLSHRAEDVGVEVGGGSKR